MFYPTHLKDNKNMIKRSPSKGLSHPTAKVPPSAETGISFSRILETEIEKSPPLSRPTSSPEEISSLVSDLENQGQALSRLPSLENFYQFRKTLQQIMHRIIPQTLELQKDYSINTTTLTQKEFHLITGVNRELESLLKMIETNHRDHFVIANKVVSIKGLIVDFYG